MDPGEYRQLFRRFFGYNPQTGQGRFPPSDEQEYRNNGESSEEFTNSRGFSIYSDPLEVNRFFEQQMDEMLRMFSGSFGFSFGGFPSDPNSSNSNRFEVPSPSLLEPEDGTPNGYARDFMLKDSDKGQPRPRVDSEVDWDKLDMDELDQLMSKKTKESPAGGTIGGGSSLFEMIPRQPFGQGSVFPESPGSFSFKSFGSSMTEKTIKNQDGGIETVRTVRNSDGSETRITRKQLGDKSYERVTTTDKNGQSSSEEKLINISESELEHFKNTFGTSPYQSPLVPSFDPRTEMIHGPIQDSTFYRMWDKFFGK